MPRHETKSSQGNVDDSALDVAINNIFEIKTKDAKTNIRKMSLKAFVQNSEEESSSHGSQLRSPEEEVAKVNEMLVAQKRTTYPEYTLKIDDLKGLTFGEGLYKKQTLVIGGVRGTDDGQKMFLKNDEEEEQEQDSSDPETESDEDEFPEDASCTRRLVSSQQEIQKYNKMSARDAFIKHYRENIKENTRTYTISYEGYKITEEDVNDMYFTYDNGVTQDSCKFKVQRKFLTIFNARNYLIPIVVTIEQVRDENTNKILKTIKTLNIYNDQGYFLQKSILLEQMTGETSCWFLKPSIIQNNNMIYFYRKELTTYKLFKYDLLRDTLEQCDPIYDITTPREYLGFHINFAQKFGRQQKKKEEVTYETQEEQQKIFEQEFLDEQFVLLQQVTDLEIQKNGIEIIACLDDLQIPLFEGQKIQDDITQFFVTYKEKEKVIKKTQQSANENQALKRSATRTLSSLSQIDTDYYDILFIFMHSNKITHWDPPHDDIQNLADNEDYDDHSWQQYLSQCNATCEHLVVESARIQPPSKVDLIDQYYVTHNMGLFNRIIPIYPIEQLSKNEQMEEDEKKHQEYFEQKEEYIVNLIKDAKGLDPNVKDSSIYKIIQSIDNKMSQPSVYFGSCTDMKDILGSYIDPAKNQLSNVIFKEDVTQQTAILNCPYDDSNTEIFKFKLINQKTMQIYEAETEDDFGEKSTKTEVMGTQKLSDKQQLILNTIFEQRDNIHMKMPLYINALYQNAILCQHVAGHQGSTFIKLQKGKKKAHQIDLPEEQLLKRTIIEIEEGLYKIINIKIGIFKGDQENQIYFRQYDRYQDQYVFIFDFVVKKEYENEARQMTFFVIKSSEFIHGMTDVQAIIQDLEDEVLVLGKNRSIHEMKIEKLQTIIQTQSLKQLSKVQVRFESIIDMSEDIPFIPFYYQEKFEKNGEDLLKNRSFAMFDINKRKISAYFPLNSAYGNLLSHDVTNTTIAKSSRMKISNDQVVIKYQIMQRYIQLGDMSQATEILVRYFSKKPVQLQLIGMKQVFETYASQNDPCFSKGYYYWNNISFYDSDGLNRGTQLIRLNQDKNKLKRLKVIGIYDQNHNNIFTKKTDFLQFGYQKFYNSFSDLENYHLVIAARIRSKYLNCDNPKFDNTESMQILTRIISKLRSMRTMNFRFVVLNSCFEMQKKSYFFISREFFNGKSLCDICINDPLTIIDALKKDKETITRNDSSLIDQLLVNQNESMKKVFNQYKLEQEAMIIQEDFNFITQITRGIQMNCISSVNILLKHLFNNFNEKEYRILIMLELTQILGLDDISNIFGFFSRSQAEQADDLAEYCAIEENIINHKLPVMSSEQLQCILVNDIKDIFDTNQQMSQLIMKREQEENESDSDSDEFNIQEETDSIEVEHKLLDFSFLIIGEKMRNPQLNNFNDFELNHKNLSEILLQEDSENLDFYNQEFVQKLINIQFPKTYIYFQRLMLFYIISFFVPLIIVIISNYEDNILTRVCFGIMCFSQTFYFSLECIQCRITGFKEYFMDFFNSHEYSQFFLFNGYVIYKYTVGYNEHSPYEVVLNILIVIQSFIKILFFIRIFEQYGFLVQMIGVTFVDVTPFLVFFVLFILFFSLIQIVLRTDIDQGNSITYLEVNEMVKYIIQTYRNSIGDINVPEYTSWVQFTNDHDDETELTLMLILIWGFWFMNQILMLIILLNFLIAVISATYERVNEDQVKHSYKHKAILNYEAYKMFNFFKPMQKFKALIISSEKNLLENDDNSLQQAVQEIRKYQDASVATLTKAIKTELDNKIKAINVEMRSMENTLLEEINEMKELFEKKQE